MLRAGSLAPARGDRLLPRRHRAPAHKRVERPSLMPPNLQATGTLSFTQQDREALRAWLAEGGWPRGSMDGAMLEGYLVALLVWPVGIPTGAWLPPIWGERGWKVPSKIATRSQFDEFVALVVGFMRTLDRSLAQQPSRFESSVLRGLGERARVAGLQAWGKGFMTALALGSQGLKWRNGSAGAAVRVIAANTSASAPLGPNGIEEVVSCVFTLMAQRGSRGPLGPLETGALPDMPVARPTEAGRGASSPKPAVRSI